MKKELNLKQSLLTEMLRESLTRSEFESLAVKIATKMKELEKRNLSEVEKIGKAVSSSLDNVKNLSSSELKAMKEKIDSIITESVNTLNETVKQKVREIEDKLASVKDGRDADEETIVGRVLEMIKIPEMPIIPDIKKELSDLNKLKRYLKKLDDKFADLNQRFLSTSFGSMNPAYPFYVDSETPSGTVNGSNKAFVLANIPSPASSLRVYVNGQRMTITEDYTFSGSTITFVTAPPTGSVVRVDYRLDFKA